MTEIQITIHSADKERVLTLHTDEPIHQVEKDIENALTGKFDTRSITVHTEFGKIVVPSKILHNSVIKLKSTQ